MFKLRTMRLHDPEGAYVITHKLDARVFALGRLLRRFRIDEMPQLFNVVRARWPSSAPGPKTRRSSSGTTRRSTVRRSGLDRD